MSCFVQPSGGISAVLSAQASCAPGQKLSARIAVQLNMSGTWTFSRVALSVEVQA